MSHIRFSQVFLSVTFFLIMSSMSCSEEIHSAKDSFSSVLALSDGEHNTVFSPYGADTLAAMMAVGAKAETFDELQQAFHLPTDTEGIAALRREMEPRPSEEAEERASLLVANGLWIAEGLQLSPAFQEQITTGFRASLKSHDFAAGSETNGLDINTWVQHQTGGKISSVTNGFAPETQMLLVNAIYFCCDWLTAFDPANTKHCDFTSISGEKIAVPMMQQEIRCHYFKNDEVACVLLPYTQENLGMFLVLPKNADAWKLLEADISPSSIVQWQEKMVLETVDCMIPKFRIESSINMKPVFEQLGVRRAFDRENADFSGITDTRHLFVSEVVQKVTFVISESGTEAASSTTAVFAPKAPAGATREVMCFHADRPFFFAVLDKEKGTLIFSGRYVTPNQSESN